MSEVVPGKVEGLGERNLQPRRHPNLGRSREEQDDSAVDLSPLWAPVVREVTRRPCHTDCYELADCAARPFPEPTLPARQALYKHRTGAAMKMEL